VDGLHQTRYVPKPIKESSRHATGSVRHKITGPAPQATVLERFQSKHLDLLQGQARSHEYDAVHTRCIVFIDRRYWIVNDWLRAPTEHRYTLNFQLGSHAQDHTELSVSNQLRLRSPGLLLLQPSQPKHSHAVQSSWVSARYGEKKAAPSLRATTAMTRNADFDTVLCPWDQVEPEITLDEIAAERGDGPHPEAGLVAHRITLMVKGVLVTDIWFHRRSDTAQSWRIGGFEFIGNWVYWRMAADGQVLNAASHCGAMLSDLRSGKSVPITLDIGDTT
jgi:hypothetical protein